MAIGGSQFKYGIPVTLESIGSSLSGNGYNARYHINSYSVDLGGVDFIRIKQYYGNANVQLIIQNPIGTTVWTSAVQNSGAGNSILTFQGSAIPAQYKTTGMYLGVAYDVDRVMNAYQGTGTYMGMKIYSSTNTLVYTYTNYTVPIEINYLNYTKKFLFQDGTSIVNFSGGNRTVVGTAPVTEAMFNSFGEISLTGITSTQLNQLTVSKKLLYYSSNNTTSSATLTMKSVPNDKLVVANGDIDLSSTTNIDNFTLTATQSANGLVKIIASPNSGSTWYTYSGTWQTINLTASDVKTSGMSIATFNSANWNTLLTSSRTIRFAYLLSMTASIDVAETDKLTVQVDQFGKYSVDKDINHDISKIANDKLEISLYSNGDYQVSYLNLN